MSSKDAIIDSAAENMKSVNTYKCTISTFISLNVGVQKQLSKAHDKLLRLRLHLFSLPCRAK